MRYYSVLLEYNIDFLLNSYSTQYENIKKIDKRNPHNSLQEFIGYLDSRTRENNTFQILQPYFKWIVFRYVTGKLNKYEDVTSKVLPYLIQYDHLKKKNKLKPEHKDINQIKDIHMLMDIVDSYENIQSKKEEKSGIEQQFYDNKEATLLYNDNDIKVVIPHTEKASCYFGKNTRWCTAATKDNAFSEYEEGPLYIVLIKKKNKRYQFHFESDQFMDELDKEINPNEIADQYPVLWDIFTPIAEKQHSLRLNKNISDQTKKYLIKHGSYSLFHHIHNPSFEMALMALETDQIKPDYLFDNYKLSNEDTQKIILLMPSVLKNKKYKDLYVTEETKEKIIYKNCDDIQYLSDLSEELQLKAINIDPSSIRNISKPTQKVKEEAIKKYPSNIVYISKPSQDLIKLAFDCELQKFENDTITVKKVDDSQIRRMLRKFPQQLGYVVEKNHKIFKYIADWFISAIGPIPASIQLLAVKKNKNNIKYIPKPSATVMAYFRSINKT